MTTRDDDLRIRPGCIQHGNKGAKRPLTFVGEVMRAVKKAGHTGKNFRGASGSKGRSTFGRGRRAAASIRLRSDARRVVMKARVVRHKGTRFHSAPLPKHIAYLKREGVTRDGENARMFDAATDTADERAFAERCEDDRHHFRFIVSPEDATQMADLHAFTRELMADAERDLGTKLDWIAVDHWNIDNPHVHVLIRGRTGNGKDLVISRAYISRGFRDRAAERVTVELGPCSEQEIHLAWKGKGRWIAGSVSIGPYATSLVSAPVPSICAPVGDDPAELAPAVSSAAASMVKWKERPTRSLTADASRPLAK